MKKMCRLKQISVALILFLTASCSSPLSGVPSSIETPPPSPHPTAGESIGRGQAAQLAFVSDRRQRGNLDIWLFDLVTEQIEPLTSDDWQDVKPAWSPDGQTLAFISYEIGGSSGIRAIDLSDRMVHTLVPPERYAPVTDFVWSGDGKRIFYTIYDGQTFESHVWQFDLQTNGYQHIVDAKYPISVSTDGRYLGLTVREPKFNDYFAFRVLRLSDSMILVPIEETFGPFAPTNQAWASRENVVAVTFGATAAQLGQIAIYTVDDGQVHLKSRAFVPRESRMEFCQPVWSPNAQKVLVIRASIMTRGCKGELVQYDSDLTDYRLLPLEGQVNYVNWSGDGSQIVYGKDDTLDYPTYRSGFSGRSSGEIWLAQSTGLNARPLITGPAYNGQPAWRP